jgi:hypothetical protein
MYLFVCLFFCFCLFLFCFGWLIIYRHLRHIFNYPATVYHYQWKSLWLALVHFSIGNSITCYTCCDTGPQYLRFCLEAWFPQTLALLFELLHLRLYAYMWTRGIYVHIMDKQCTVYTLSIDTSRWRWILVLFYKILGNNLSRPKARWKPCKYCNICFLFMYLFVLQIYRSNFTIQSSALSPGHIALYSLITNSNK